jgi:cyclophilin family peptidyl-prolyl cis-trans isomerase
MVAFALVLALALPSPAPAASAAPAAPVAPAAPAGPVVVLETNQGAIKLELDAVKAPISTRNFLDYVRSGHYDGTIFHRVIPGFMIQGGGMGDDMEEKETKPPIRNEARNGLRNARGTLAMARTSDPNSATSQFFINLRDNHNLDFGIAPGAGYTVFGRVIEGMDVVDRIAAVPTTTRGDHENVPRLAVVIQTARVLSAGPAAAKPAAAAPKPPAAAAPRAGGKATKPAPAATPKP